MDSNRGVNVSAGQLALGTLLAVIAGAIVPVIAVFQLMMLAPVVMLGGVLSAWLYGRGNRLPLAGFLVSAACVSALLLGGIPTVALVCASLMPAFAVGRGVLMKEPFFAQMRRGVTAYVLGLLAALLVAYAGYGSGMVNRFMDLLRDEYARMPDSALQPMVDWANTLVSQGQGIAGRALTVTYLRGQVLAILDLVEETYAQTLPGMLLSGAIISGALSVLWGNWALARRGMATNESFVGMSGWFLPPSVSIGALALELAGLAIVAAGSANGAAVYATITQAAGTAFAIQALCALNRRMLRAGRPLGRRRALIAVLSIAALLVRSFASVLSYVGIASAFMGSHGVFRLGSGGRREDDDEHDDLGD